MTEIRCISPVDGSVYATRSAEPAESVRRRLKGARAAQKAWAARPLEERIALVREGVARFSPCPIDQLVVSGGGVHNRCLMGHLERLFDSVPVMRLEELGMPGDAKEAVVFAVLANEALLGNPGNVPQVTGASRARVLGKIVPGG